MGGKVLEYEAKTIKREGIAEGMAREGPKEGPKKEKGASGIPSRF